MKTPILPGRQRRSCNTLILLVTTMLCLLCCPIDALAQQHASKEVLQKMLANPNGYLFAKVTEDEYFRLFDINDLAAPIAKFSCRSVAPNPVENDLLLVEHLPEFQHGLAKYPPIVSKPNDKESARIEIEGWQGHWIGTDLIHCFAIREGDIWLSLIDWEKRELVTERRITEIGQFDNDWEPTIWAGTSVYFKQRQVDNLIKVSLVDGSIDTGITLADPQTESLLFTPDSRAAVVVSDELVKIIDLQSSEARLIPNVVKYEHPIDSKAYLRHIVPLLGRTNFSSHSRWISPRKLAIPRLNELVVLDVESATVSILPFAKKPRNYVTDSGRHGADDDTRLELLEVFDGTGVVRVRNLVENRSVKKTFLIDFDSGQKVELPESAEKAKWISSNAYIYRNSANDPQEPGTWYYQVKPEKKIRLSEEDVGSDRRRVFLTRDSRRIFVNDGTSGSSWSVCDIDSNETKRLPQFELVIELGMLGSPINLSNDAQHERNDLHQPVFSEKSENQTIEKTERMKIAELIATMPFEIRKEAWSAYGRMKDPSYLQDPHETLRYINNRLSKNGSTFTSLWVDSKNSPTTVNLARCRFWAYEKCVENDLSLLLSETRRRSRTAEEMKLLHPEFVRIADEFKALCKSNPKATKATERALLSYIYTKVLKVRRTLDLDQRK